LHRDERDGPRTEVIRMLQATPTVFVVDDDISIRESLESLIRSTGCESETFASAQEFLARPRITTPSCLLLDISMPIIFITGHGDVPMTVRAMKAGAIEFLLKPFNDEALLRAVQYAIERSANVLRRESEIEILRNCYATLTPREREVLARVVSGLSNKQVGGELGISEITVKAHRGRVMQKMRADSLPNLVKIATRLRLTPGHRG